MIVISLLSVKREYWCEDEDSVEAKIIAKAAFDDIAPIAIFLKADCKYKKQARAALKRLKKAFIDLPEVQELSANRLIADGDTGNVDFGHIYNRLYEMIAKEYGEIGVDRYGAWGHIDTNGDEHWGDDYGFFPWYMDKETLRKDLEEYNF